MDRGAAGTCSTGGRGRDPRFPAIFALVTDAGALAASRAGQTLQMLVEDAPACSAHSLMLVLLPIASFVPPGNAAIFGPIAADISFIVDWPPSACDLVAMTRRQKTCACQG